MTFDLLTVIPYTLIAVFFMIYFYFKIKWSREKNERNKNYEEV